MRTFSAPPDRLRMRIAVLLVEPGVAERVRRRLARRMSEAETAPAPTGPGLAAIVPGLPVHADPHTSDRPTAATRERADDRLEHVAV